MSNSYFQFKQFLINQGETAMKVTTEGCLFGASIGLSEKPKRILDIGTGTGLLALMLAQRSSNSAIDAVEIDQAAYEQARSNFALSPWKETLTAHYSSIQDFDPAEKYDLIVSNPPFFKNSLKGKSLAENLAKHDQGLSQMDLLANVGHLLSDEGMFWVLYPERESKEFEVQALAAGYFIREKIIVRNHQDADVFRVIQCFVNTSTTMKESTLCIKEKGAYTAVFTQLLAPFYLDL